MYLSLRKGKGGYQNDSQVFGFSNQVDFRAIFWNWRKRDAERVLISFGVVVGKQLFHLDLLSLI